MDGRFYQYFMRHHLVFRYRKQSGRLAIADSVFHVASLSTPRDGLNSSRLYNVNRFKISPALLSLNLQLAGIDLDENIPFLFRALKKLRFKLQ